MDFKPKNREWVKNAAIVFLAALTVLTFFSNTIMNHSLPEAATAYVTNGTITAKVRGSGKVVASGRHEVKAKEMRTIRAVMVKAGQEVNTGDVLFVLGEGDSTELEAAEDTLRQLRLNYQSEALSMPASNYSSEEWNVYSADQRYQSALERLNEAIESYNSACESPVAKAAAARMSAAKEMLNRLEQEYGERYAALSEYDAAVLEYNYQTEWILPESEQNEEEEVFLETESPEEPKWVQRGAENGGIKAAEDRIDAAKKGMFAVGLEENEYKSAEDYNIKYYENVEKIMKEIETYEAEYEQVLGTYKYALEQAQDEELSAHGNLISAQSARDRAYSNDSKNAAQISLRLQDLAQQIKRQEDKIREMSGDYENQITASVSGVVDSISCTAGDTVLKDTLLCTIEVPDMGYTLSFTATNDQAQRLRVGDTATVSNFYWGQEVIATLASIRNDPKNPQNNKLLTFDLTGDVSSGSELTISVGSKSANYDIIIPNSAIRNDANGSFVYAVEAKNSPLGNRYIAKRVKIDVLAADDENSAVTGGLNNGDYVITSSSAPINNGDQVRMADSGT